jgi:hypothetical protein
MALPFCHDQDYKDAFRLAVQRALGRPLTEDFLDLGYFGNMESNLTREDVLRLQREPLIRISAH